MGSDRKDSGMNDVFDPAHATDEEWGHRCDLLIDQANAWQGRAARADYRVRFWTGVAADCAEDRHRFRVRLEEAENLLRQGVGIAMDGSRIINPEVSAYFSDSATDGGNE